MTSENQPRGRGEDFIHPLPGLHPFRLERRSVDSVVVLGFVGVASVRDAVAVLADLFAFELVVDNALDGEEGFWLASENQYDAIVLDIMLPKLNGFQVCAKLREAGIWTPILMLTAKHGELDGGCDVEVEVSDGAHVVGREVEAIRGCDWSALPVTDVPTLILRGEHSYAAVYPTNDQTSRIASRGEITTLTGQGHLGHVFAPSAFATTMLEFADRH